MSMHEQLTLLEDAIAKAKAIGHLMSDKAGNLHCAESIGRAGSMVEDYMRDAEAALEAIYEARRAERGLS